MNSDVETALSTLQSDPQNTPAWEALDGFLTEPAVTGNGSRPKITARLAAARAWHLDRGEVEPALQLLGRELALESAAPKRAELLVEQAQILYFELCRSDAGKSALREALDIDPGNAAAAALAARVEADEADWEPSAAAKLQEAKEGSGKPALVASAWAAAGELYLRHRPRSSEGEVFLRRALEVDPKQRRADALLERLLRAEGRDEELAALVEKRVEAFAGGDERAGAEVAAGRLALARRQEDVAIEHFRRAVVANPAEPRALAALNTLLSKRGEWVELARLLEAGLRATKRGPNENAILVPLATAVWKGLGQMDAAELHFRRLKKADPQNQLVLDFYRDFHTRRNEIPQLLSLLAAVQKAEPDPERRVRIGIEMAEIAESRPQSAEKAIDIWKGLLRLKPGLPEATTALRRLYTKTEKWNALLELLKDDVEALPAEAVGEKIARYLEMIPIYRDRLRLEVMVTNTYNQILGLKPDHVEALDALAHRHEAQGRWTDLIDVLLRRVATMSETPEKIAIYHRVATLWAEKLGKQQNAVGALEKVLELDPSDFKARTALRDIHTRSRSWRALLELLRGELALVSSNERRTHLAAMAQLAADRLNDPKQAIALWNEVLALDAADAEALAALAGLYEREKRWAALAEVLGRLARAAGEATDAGRAHLERRASILHERLSATAEAEETLRLVLASDAANVRAIRALRDIYADTRAFDKLEALYAGRGAWDELAEAFSSLADRTNDTAERASLLRRVAEIAQERLKQPERALKAYERILAADPSNRGAAQRLVGLYRSTERWAKLLSTYEVLLAEGDGAPARPERLALLQDARKIAEEKLSSKGLAFQWCARAYDVAPEDETIVADIERLGRDADEWTNLSQLYLKRLGAEASPPSDDERKLLLRRLLRIARARLNRPAEARRYAEELLQLAPGDEEAEASLERLFAEENDWGRLVEVLHRRADRLSDERARADLLARVAEIEEEKLGDREAAARTFRALSDRDPKNPRVLAGLARNLEALGDAHALADVLRRQAGSGLDDERGTLMLKVAELEETKLDNPKAALEAFLRVLDLDSVSEPAALGLERLVERKVVDGPALREVLQRLIPYFELTEKYDKWAKTLATLVDLEEEPSARVAGLEILIDLYMGPLVNPRAAFEAALRVFEIEPGNYAQHSRLLSMAIEAGEIERLLAALRGTLEKSKNPVLRRELLVIVAEAEEKQGTEGVTQAEGVYRQILDVDPLHFGAYRSLTRFYRDAERWRDLRGLLEVRAGAVPDAKERLQLLWQIAEIDEALLEDSEHAIGVLHKIIEAEPADLRAYRTLERHYAATTRWAELEALLARLVPIVPPAERVDVKFRRAEVAQRRLKQPAHALDILEDVLTIRPQHEGTRRLVEELLEVPSERQRSAAILEPLYEVSGDWAKLASILEVQREAAGGEAAVELLGRIAELQERRLGDPGAAFRTWGRVLEADPQSERGLAEAERLATSLERFADLVALYESLASKVDPADIASAADLLGRAARLQLARFGDRERAIATWRRILDLDPTNVETARPAVEALEDLYNASGDFRGLVETLRVKVEWAADPDERSVILGRIADIEERSLGDLPAAVLTFRSVLDHDAESGRALDELERLYEALGQHRDRVEILRRKVALAESEGARETLRFRMASILEQQLGDVDEAISTVLSILDESAQNRPALEALAALYEKKGAVTERLEVLERQLVLAEDRGVRVEILRRMAELLAGPLGRLGDALERWKEILALAPQDAGALGSIERLLDNEDLTLRLAAAKALEPLYESASDWPRLRRIVEIYVETAEDARERMEQRTRLAELQERRLADAPGAMASYAAAIRNGLGEPQLGALLDAYERLADGLGAERAREVIDLYEEVEIDVLSDEVRLRMIRTIARRAQTVGDLALATENHRKVLERVPEDRDALSALEEIHRATDDLPALLDVLSRRADLVGGALDVELPLRLQVGQLALKLDKTDEATSAFERVWKLRPGEPEATAALETIYEGGRHWFELADLLERQLQRGLAGGSGTVVDTRLRLAQIALRELADRDKALEQLGLALREDQEHEGAIGLLQELLTDPDARLRAADLLEPVYVRRNDWAKLVSIDELRIEHTDDPTRRLSWVQRVARVSEEQLDDLDASFRWYARAFREAPLDKDVQDELLRIAPKVGRWKEVAQLLGDFLEDELGNSDEVLDLVRLAATVSDERVGDRESARKHYRRYLDALPNDPQAARLLEQALERWESWTELRELLGEQASRLAEPYQRISYLRRSARLSEERLGDREQAVSDLRGVLDLEPMDLNAAQEIERLLRAEQSWSDLREHLLWMLDRAPEQGDQNAIAFGLAEVEEQRLEMIGSAVERYGEILARTPRHGGALAALERLIANGDHRHRVAELLEPHFRRLQDWRKLADVLEVLLEGTEEVERRIAILQEVAALEERMGRPDRAIEARGRAWLEDVTASDTLSALEELATSARLFPRMAELLQEGAELAVDPDLQSSLCAKRARLLESRLGDAGRAIEAWRGALDAKPDDEAAFGALERLLAQAGRSAELCETLERHIEIAKAPEDRKALSKRVALLYEDALKRSDRAVDAWRSVLELDAADEEALEALARLYTAAAEWRDLADIYQRQIELAPDAARLRQMHFLAARLHDEKLGDASEAASHLRAVLDVQPGDAEALELLDRIFTRDEQHPELLEILDQRAAVASTAAERDALAFRAAELLEKTLGDGGGAIERYRKILDGTPGHEGARGALWSIAKGQAESPLAVAVLEPVFRAGREWSDLVSLLELKLGNEEGLGPRLEILADIARIEEQERGDGGKAFDAWARAFAEEPGEPAPAEALERLAAASGDHARLAKVYEERITSGVDPTLAERLAWRLAELWEERLGEPARALEYLRQVADVPGQESRALARIETLLRRLERWRELEEVLSQEADLTPEPAASADFLAALGDLRLSRLEDPQGAVDAFKAALDRAPEHAAAVEALRPLVEKEALRADVLDTLEPLAEARGDHPELARLLEIRARHEEDPDTQAGLWLRIGELCEQRLGDLGRALEAYGKALEADPLAMRTADELERIATAAGLPLEAAQRFERVISLDRGGSTVDFSLRAARLHEAAPGRGPEQDTAAERLYRAVLAEEAENSSALEALERLYRRQSESMKLAAILERRGSQELDPARREELYGEAARLHEGLGDLKAAVAAWHAVREADDGNAVALRELARLYEAQGETVELVNALEERARFSEDREERLSLGLRIGRLKAEALKDEEGAAAAYRDVLDVDPGEPTALEALSAIEERRGDWEALEEILLRRLGAVSGGARMPVLLQLARNAEERLSDTDRAAGYLHEVLGIDPAYEPAFVALAALLRKAERWHDLIEILERRAAAEERTAPAAAIATRLAIAGLWGEQLGDEATAAEAIEKVLDAQPRHGGALLALAGLRERAEQWDEAAAALEQAASAVDTAAERAEVQFRRGRVLAARGASQAEIEACYQAALEADPTHARTIEALEQIARKGGDTQRLVQLLEGRARVATETVEKRALLTEIAGLYTGPLGQPGAAVAALTQLAELSPTDLKLREELARALAASGKTAEAEAILTPLVAELTKARQPKVAARLQQLLGAFAEARGDIELATERLRAAYQVDPMNAATVAGLGRLAMARKDHDGARRFYQALLLQTFDEKAAGITKAEVYLALGRLHMASNELPKARNMFERGLEKDPQNVELRQMLKALR